MTHQGSIFNSLPVDQDSTHKPPPPLADVRALWDAAREITSDVDAVRLLTERTIDPSLVARYDLARVITRKTELPSWAAFRPREGELHGRSWYETGHRLLVPLCDSAGTMRSVKARSVFFNPHKKTINPLDYGLRGLCLLPLFERHRLEADPVVVNARAKLPPGRWVIAEGDMDYLTWATRIIQNLDDPTYLVGIYSGAFNLSWGQALVGQDAGAPPDFYIRIHHDKSGDGYTDKIAGILRSLAPTSNIYRSKESGLVGHERDDDNKLAQHFMLNIDPRHNCELWTPPVILATETQTPEAQTPAQRARISERTENAAEARFYTSFVDNAIRKAADEVRGSAENNHNNELFRCASAVARFQHTPFWNEVLFRQEFKQAAIYVGQNVFEIESTLNSAFDAARRDPQNYDLPKFNPKAAPKPPSPKRQKPDDGQSPDLETSDSLDLPDDITDDGEVIELEEWAEGETRRARLNVGSGTYEAQLNAAERLIAGRLDTFTRNNALVQVLASTEGFPVVSPLKQSHVRTRLDSLLACYTRKSRKNGSTYDEPCSVPIRLVAELHESGNYPSCRPLQKIVKHPVLLPGSHEMALTPGYYIQGGVLYSPVVRVTIDPIPDAPTKEMALEAYKELAEPFIDFRFGDKPAEPGQRQRNTDEDTGEAAVVSLILAHLIRPLITNEFVPMYLIDATTPGTGKSTLLAAINALCVGTPGFSQAEVLADTTEETKRLVTWALSGRSGMVVFDNAATGMPVGNAVLDGVLTSGRVEARVLGGHELADVALDMIFTVTGNNITLRGDMVRRCVPIVLTAPPGDLETRDFKYDNLVGHILANRGRLLRAALVILRAWAAAKKKPQTKPFASFPTWSHWCRDSLVWLGLPDFVAQTRSRAASSDAQLSAFSGLLAALHKTQCGLLTMTRLKGIYENSGQDSNAISQEIVEACNNLGFFDGGKWQNKRVSSTLGAYQGRTLGGYALRPVVPFSKWTVEVVKKE